jgi:glycosyltransferase involved in cell wall biosynthesis
MKLAFYYHIPVINQEGKLYMPGFIGVFVDSLAENCEELFLVAHTLPPSTNIQGEYLLKSNNIKLISLGGKTPAWHREIFHKSVLKNAIKKIEECEVLLVRSPTPLAAHFGGYLKRAKLWYMVVGDYLEAIDHLKTSGIRNRLIYYYLHLNDLFFQKALAKYPMVVNSPSLFIKYKKVNSRVFQIKTTTLSKNDFYLRDNTCQNNTIQLLYTGSFSAAKGLFELVDALKILIDSGMSLKMNFVGWEEGADKPVQTSILEKAKLLNIFDSIVFHGKKKIGEDLNQMYRMTDLYVIPSHHEGFPRTIWEAMANGLPVIATKVGGIPHYLTDKENAILIEPKSVNEIVESIKLLIGNELLRKNIIKKAYALVEDNTLDVQSKKLIEIIKNK